MNTNKKFLNQLFNNLSSIYSSNDGMINSNLFTIFNAYAGVFQNIDDIRQDTKNNTYLNYANTDVLEANFSPYVDFPKPPRLNTVTNGGEIYRAILRSIYNAFLNGSTEDSMDVGLSTILSYLTIDSRTDSIISESNNAFFNTFDRTIQLAYPAIYASGITILPSGLTVTDYNSSTNTITFTGSIPTSGQSYVISYFRDHTSQIDTNWINFTDPSGTNPLSYDLNTIENTFQNPKFSYWWDTYNRDGNGVKIIDGTLLPSEVGLVWRLPEKYITYNDPYTLALTKTTIDLYNLSGTVYDINSSNKECNPDVQQNTKILSYVNEVSRTPNNYYIRYSQNNSIFTALDTFLGNVNQVEKVSDKSVDFSSDNFGILDFFEKGANFDINDLFGKGTKNVWLNVPNINKTYSLSSETFFDRPYSLHENILFYEFLENGQRSLNRFSVLNGSICLAEAVGTPIQDTENCLMLFGDSVNVSPIIASGIIANGNKISIDLYDGMSSGTSTGIDVKFVNPINNLNNGEFKLTFPSQNSLYDVLYSGSNGYLVQNTIPNYFVNTYFDNIDDLNYNISVLSGGNITLSGESIYPSHPNSLVVSGIGNRIIYANLNDLSNVDYIEFRISKNENFNIQFNYSDVGLNSVSYSTSTTGLFWNKTSGKYSIGGNSGHAVLVSDGPPAIYSGQGSGGGSVVGDDPNPTLPFATIVFSKSKGNFIDGILPIILNNFIDGLGRVTFDVNGLAVNNPYIATAITLNIASGTNLYHYEIGNKESANNFYSGNYDNSYYYQIAYSGENINNRVKNTLPVPRSEGWHRFAFNLGSGMNNISAELDNYEFLNVNLPYSGNFGFAGNVFNYSGISLLHSSINPDIEFSYFDNVKLSYYNSEKTNPQYNYLEDFTQDWQGSYLDQNTVISNRTFKGSRQANFTFELIILGLQNKFIYIIEDIVNKLKPAHTLVDINIQTNHILNTTSILSEYVNDSRDWETGNLTNNIEVTTEVVATDILDLPGTIQISGASI